VDTWNRKQVVRAIRSALANEAPSVVIARGPCQRLPEMKRRAVVPYFVDEELCTQCDACYTIWCPAITRNERGFPQILAADCTACTVCAQMCPPEAIYPQASASA
jgi:indolepyruvate ferredoxin oxidoreductase alpha subunit